MQVIYTNKENIFRPHVNNDKNYQWDFEKNNTKISKQVNYNLVYPFNWFKIYYKVNQRINFVDL